MLSFSPVFFRRLQQLKIHTRRSFLGSRQGMHLSKRKGQGLEFADFRAYTPGDDYRHIDWGVYGRTDRVYVRQFREEQDLNVLVILDCSRSMGVSKDQQKFEFASNIALALGYVALTDGDTVTISLLGQKNSPRFSGPKSLSLATAFIKEAKAEYVFDLKTELRAACSRHKIPGKCFLISDFLIDHESLFPALDVLRYRNFEISLIQILAPSELNLEIETGLTALDAETGEKLELILDSSSKKEYEKALALHTKTIEEYALRYGITHILLSSEEDLSSTILTKFPEAGILI
jgi:uncharacterized protein (DUF58 family)